MTKYTEGPYVARRAREPRDGEYDYAIIAAIDGEEHIIGEAFGRVSEHIRPEAAANARLFVASLVLLEAAKKVLHRRLPQLNFDLAGHEDMQALQDAVKYAELE